MLSITLYQLSKTAAAGAFIALTTLSSAVAGEVNNLGPVGPHVPILTSVGATRVIAFYEPGSNQCALNAVIWDKTNSDTTPARIRISLEPGQIVHIDSPENESLNLQCGRNADSLSLVNTDDAVAFGITMQPAQPLKASASGF